MTIDLKKLLVATNPTRTLAIENPDDRQYYINFASVRGGEIIGKLKNQIMVYSSGDTPMPTCTLFTGHLGCGKSTELLRLKYELEQEGFHVVYFESDEDLELSDVDIGDIFLAIARRVSQSLAHLKLSEPRGLKDLLQQAVKFLNTEIDISADVNIPIPYTSGLGQVKVSDEGLSIVAAGIGKITAKVKSDAILRDKLSQFLAPQKTQLLDLINRELITPGTTQLRQQDKKGLVVIVDNLDRIDNTPKFKSGLGARSQQEYLFIDQGEFLRKLGCHLVYTMPLALNFSGERETLVQRLGDPRVLPMVPVNHRDGSEYREGLDLLRQMVLARAFPDLSPPERLVRIPELFDEAESLDRLCRVSGGHARNLLRLLNSWIGEFELPLQRETLENLIRLRRSEISQALTNIAEQLTVDGWEMLRQVQQTKSISGNRAYQAFIRNLYIYEYRDRGEPWYDINPILAEARELQV
jgi:hypothetical protein